MVRILESSERDMDVTCVGEGESCARYFTGDCPDLLLLQEKSTPGPFEDFVREMVDGFAGLRIIVFGRSMADDYLCRVIEAGARGYINEKMNGDHMVMAVEAVMQGRYWVERHIMEQIIEDRSIVDGIRARVSLLGDRLTSRESEVLELIMLGLSTREIAERIFLSHQGVKAHLTTLFRKFGVRNRAQLILRVLDEVSPVESITGMMQEGLQVTRMA
jgi:DNA-binding NarL/FixJ family response regulator